MPHNLHTRALRNVREARRTAGLFRFRRIKPRCYCGRPRTNDVSTMTTPNAAVSKVLKRLHYPLDVMLTCVRWYVAYPLSLRHLEEMMSERSVSVDHSTLHR